MVASLVGSSAACKACSAMLRNKNSVGAAAIEIDGSQHYAYEKGYDVKIQVLPRFSTAQLVMVARTPSLLFGEKVSAVYRYVMSDEFSTPMLPEWAPYLCDVLESSGALYAAEGFGEEVSLCHVSQEKLDEIVSTGLKKGELKVSL